MKSKDTSIISFSLLLVLIIALIAYKISVEYYENHSYFFDAAEYMAHNIELYKSSQFNNQISLACTEYLTGISPFRTIPLILFCEHLLAHPYGHMFSGLFMFLIFVICSGALLIRYLDNFIISAAVLSLIASISLLYSPFWGITAYWLDFSASFLLAASTSCLLLWHKEKKSYFLIAFSILLSLTFLSRYIFTAFSIWVLTPIYFFVIYSYWKKEKDLLKTVIKPTIWIVTIILSISGLHLINNYTKITNYYEKYGYALGHSWKDSCYDFLSFIQTNVGYIYIGLALIILSLIFLFRIKPWKKYINELIISIWLLISIPIFIIFILNSYSSWHINTILLPISFIAYIYLICSFGIQTKCIKYISISLFLISGLAVLQNHIEQTNLITKNAPSTIEEKKLHDYISSFLSEQKRPITWGSFFNEINTVVNVNTFYKHNVVIDKMDGVLFSLHEKYFSAEYPNLSPEETSKKICEKLDQILNVAIVFENPNNIDSINWLNNQYSKQIAKDVAIHVKSSPMWEKMREYSTKRYSTLALYRKINH